MKPHSSCLAGFSTPRLLSATALCVCSLAFAMMAFAQAPIGPNPGSGTLKPAVTLKFTDPIGPVPNATGEGLTSPPVCAQNGVDCSIYTLTLDPSLFTSLDPAKNNISIQLSWSPTQIQYGSFVEDKNGNMIASNTAGIDPETITIPLSTANLQANGPYTIVTTLEIGAPGTGYSGSISVVPLSAPGNACNGCVPPRYQAYEAPAAAATQSGEPSIGVDWNPNVASLKKLTAGSSAHGPTKLNTGGLTMFTATFDLYQVGFDDCSSPAMTTWTDVAFVAQDTFTLDAIGFVDHFTSAALGTGPYDPANANTHTPGRVFHGELTAGDSNTSYSDDDGNTHIQTQGGGVPQGPDHETIGGGPYNLNAVPPPPSNPTYQNAIYYCTQNIAPEAECSRSDDGGLTFGPGVPIYQNPEECTGSIHGHVKVARDGTVYVPNYSCTIPGVGNQGVAVSTDNGLTWTERNVPGSGSPKPGLVDPSVAVALNDTGKPTGQASNTIYLGYINNDGTPHIAVSHDQGQTWSNDQNVGGAFGIVNSTFPGVIAGDDNRAAFAFLGTTTPGDSSLDTNFPGIWHEYIATTYDGGKSYITIDATPNDPVQVGPVCNAGTTCSTKRNLLDFIGFDVDSEGRGLVGLADGCVNCANSATSADSNAAQGLVLRQSGGPRLFSAFDPAEPAAPAAPQAIAATQQDANSVSVSWLEPDNGGSPITGYKIYRGSSSGAETLLATVTNDPTHTANKYLDTTAVSGPSYFYHVTALNSVGESGFCEELKVAGATATQSACAAPFVQVEGAGAAGNVPTDPTSGELTIQSVSVGEPFTSCTDNSLTFTMKVATLDPAGTGQAVLPPNSEWQILFGVTDTGGNPQQVYVSVDTFSPNTPATPAVTLGRRDGCSAGCSTFDSGVCTQGGTVPSSCPVISATTSADGTITFKVDVSKPLNFPAPTAPGTGNAFTWDASKPGTKLGAITGNTFFFVGAGAGFLETVQTTGSSGKYARQGNLVCGQAPPVAKLTADKTGGRVPVTINFDGSASVEPFKCATLNTYTIDFGDGSSPVTQNSPTFSHNYSTPGSFTASLTVADTAGQTSVPAQVPISVFPPSAVLLNISTRLPVQTSDNAMIGGFIVTGASKKNVLVRAIGPSLATSDGVPVSGRLADPTLELYDGNQKLIAFDDNWKDSQQTAIEQTTLQPSNDLESAIVANLDPGAYTAVMRGKDNTTGIGLVEAYDLDNGANNTELANISTRGFVQTGDNVIIGGFIAGPATQSNASVIIRGLGPSLSAKAVPNPLQDPTLELRDVNGNLLASNDDWQTDSRASEVQSAGLAPTDSHESALITAIGPGHYTAIVRGKNSTTGNGLVEVYNLH